MFCESATSSLSLGDRFAPSIGGAPPGECRRPVVAGLQIEPGSVPGFVVELNELPKLALELATHERRLVRNQPALLRWPREPPAFASARAPSSIVHAAKMRAEAGQCYLLSLLFRAVARARWR